MSEAHVNGEYERWEGLTEEQSYAVRKMYSDQGIGLLRSGRMV
jgi:hypothetical protein